MVYVIKEGRHYPSPCMGINLKLFNKKTDFSTHFSVLFRQDCAYYIDTDQSDINKLYGFSYGMHHNESDRIGWRYLVDERKMELVLYSYVGGKVIKKPITKIYLGERHDIAMSVHIDKASGKRYIDINIDSFSYHYELESPKCYWFTYDVSLYFGGNRTAPHRMHVEIDPI